MKIAIIDPVVGVRKEYLKQDAAYLKKHLRKDTEFEFEEISAGFPSVETVTQDVINGAHIIKKVLEIQDKNYDGIFINCFDDPGVLASGSRSRTVMFTILILPISWVNPCSAAFRSSQRMP